MCCVIFGWSHVSTLKRSKRCNSWSCGCMQCEVIPVQGYYRPWGFQEVETPRFRDIRYTKVVRLSAVSTGHLYSPGNIPGTHFRQRLSRPQGHSAAGRIMSIKNSNDTFGNRTRDLPATMCPVYLYSDSGKKSWNLEHLMWNILYTISHVFLPQLRVTMYDVTSGYSSCTSWRKYFSRFTI